MIRNSSLTSPVWCGMRRRWCVAGRPTSWQAAILWPGLAETMAQREETAVQHLQRVLSVKQVEGSHIIQVDVTASDPAKAARIANAVVNQYLDDEIAAKYRTTDRAYQWATAQVSTQRQQLIAAENAAVEYMVAHELTASNGLRQPNEAPPGVQLSVDCPGNSFSAYKMRLTAARSQLAAKEARAAELAIIQARTSALGLCRK